MVIVFDVNGTLLDTQALQPVIRQIFGGKLNARDWFHQLLQHAMATSLTQTYRSFDELAVDVLRMAASAHGVNLRSGDIARVKTRLGTLPPFSDVKGGLEKLRAAKFRLVVLTNSATATLEQQLNSSGLDDYFEEALSVDRVRRYKPAPETYKFAAQSLGVQPAEVLMVAAHAWDLMGASLVGCRTCFIRRPGQALVPDAPRPTYVANDLLDLAAQLAPASGSRKGMHPAGAIAAGASVAGLAFALSFAMRNKG